jgi:tripartite-type tricarboxylate transporter receptor subunit TctC
VLASRLTQILNQQVVVENKPGAGSSLAADYVSHAAKDGYTLLIGTSANLTNAVISQPNLGFDFVKDFAPIALITTAPVILVVNPSLGVSSVQELIALAKKKPGEINYASTGVGAAPHLAGELFNARAGIKTVHVPYQGSPQAVTDLLAGRVSMMFSPASAVLPHVKDGKLKALASAASKRPSAAPDLPTMAEAGVPDFDTSIWFGLMAPVGTPRPIVDKLAAAVNEALKSDELKASYAAQGFDLLGGGPQEFARTIATDTARWEVAARAAGLKK